MRVYASIALLVLAAAAAPAPGQHSVAEAGKTFQKCQGCHQPPDPQLASDRAWLDQLRRTA